MHSRAEKAQAAGRVIESKDWLRVYRQLWGLLPAFASQPLDLAETLQKEVAANPVSAETEAKQSYLIPRLLELLHDSCLRETACNSIVSLGKSASPPSLETPQLQHPQQQQQHMEGFKAQEGAKRQPTQSGLRLLGLLRRLADAAAAAEESVAPAAAAADVKAAAAAAACAARVCSSGDSTLIAGSVAAAATAASNRRALAGYAEATLGFLTVRYLLLHKETGAATKPEEEAFAALSASAKARAAQLILQAIQVSRKWIYAEGRQEETQTNSETC